MYLIQIHSITEHCTSQCALEQSKCLQQPSKIQHGASECQWDAERKFCNPAGIPKDRTFTILVALLTTILSVPLLVAFTFVLEQYASTWPGSRGIEDDVGKVDEDPELDDNGESTVEPDSAAALRQSTRKSDFEEVIKRAVLRGGMAGKDLSVETVQRAYAGK